VAMQERKAAYANAVAKRSAQDRVAKGTAGARVGGWVGGWVRAWVGSGACIQAYTLGRGWWGVGWRFWVHPCVCVARMVGAGIVLVRGLE
jgi:hypothetical protein